MKSKFLCKFILTIVFLTMCELMKSQNIVSELVDMPNILGVEISYSGILFDAGYTRENYIRFKQDNTKILDNRNDIEYFCSLLDSLNFFSKSGQNQYNDDSWIFTVPIMSNAITVLPEFRAEVFGYAKIFYKNGRQPKIIWFGPCVAIDRRLYQMPISIMDKLYDFVNTRNLSNKSTEIISRWQSWPIDCSSISTIKVLTLSESNQKPISRFEFISELRHSSTKIQEFSIFEINEFMNVLKNLEFKCDLAFGTDTPARQSHIDKNGNLVWTDISDPVIGLIMIHRMNEKSPELIWITESGIDRDYSSFYRSDKIDQILKISHL